MTAVMQQDKAGLLRTTLKFNSVFSTVSGAVFVVGAGALASFMGVEQPILLAALGIGVLIFAFIVYRIASETLLDAKKGMVILILDIVWVVGSALLLFADPLTLTNEGKWLVLIVADIVGIFAIAEYFGLRRMR
jgi:hypothetical protein